MHRPARWTAGGTAVVVALVLAVVWSVTTGSATPTRTGHAGTVTPGPSADPTSAPAHHPPPALPSMSLNQMAGQRVIYSYGGLTPPAGLLTLIRHGEVGGVIFFTANISSESQLAGVVKELDAANASASNPMHAYPLLLMTDQEGGEVRRLPGEPVLSEKQIGESAHPAAAASAAGSGAGQNLKGVGLDVNLAPVLDVYRTPGDFDDQFGRSYSTNPQVVSRLGRDFVRAQQATGVAATVKHFPGLGAATKSQNTDLRPVTLHVSLHALHTIDEYPYQAAIAAGAKLVMLDWAIYPALDPKLPAGLSPTVVNGELRQRLKYPGATITDALEAGALAPFGTIPRRAVMAAQAGMDLLLCSAQHDTEGEQARTALVQGYQDGALNKTAFAAALARVAALRASLAAARG